MTLSEAIATELLPGVTVGEATVAQWKEHAALCKRMGEAILAMSNEEFMQNRELYEAWNKKTDLVQEATNVIKAEIERRKAAKAP